MDLTEHMIQHDQLVQWLFASGGPILRYRIACQWMNPSSVERQEFLEAALETPEMERWLNNLRNASAIHGSTDAHAENALGKLLEYGMDSSVEAFHESAEHLLRVPLRMWDPLVLIPFLLRAGYGDHPRVRELFQARVEILHRTASKGTYDFFLDDDELGGLPGAWRGKPIYRDEFGHASGYPLPTCYDLYALAHVREYPLIENYDQKRGEIAAYLGDPRFQGITDGYGWDREKRRCYATGRVFLACANPTRKVLFADLGSRIRAAIQSNWFQEGLIQLDSFRTERGTYLFPISLLKEKSGYYLYAGCHMGLGENRRVRQSLEMESTFWMLSIHGNLTKHAS